MDTVPMEDDESVLPPLGQLHLRLDADSVKSCTHCSAEQNTVAINRGPRLMYVWITCPCSAVREQQFGRYMRLADQAVQNRRTPQHNIIEQLLFDGGDMLRSSPSGKLTVGMFGLANRDTTLQASGWIRAMLDAPTASTIILSSRLGDTAATVFALALARKCVDARKKVVVVSERSYIAACQRIPYADVPSLVDAVATKPWLLVLEGIGGRESGSAHIGDYMAEVFARREAAHMPTIVTTAIGSKALVDLQVLVSRRTLSRDGFFVLSRMVQDQFFVMHPVK